LSEDLRAKVKRFIEEVSRDWGVKPPEVYVTTIEYADAAAYYNVEDKAIYISPRYVDLEVVLHEFAHHIEFEYGLMDRWAAWREVVNPHCQRRSEYWAKAFADQFRRFYDRLWREIVGGEKG
jgi:hypothetical protein